MCCKLRFPGRINQNRRGFTLVEIILVVVIILTLAAVVGPRLIGVSRKAKIKLTNVQIASLKTSLGQFELHAGRLPTSQEGLDALLTKPSDLDDSQWDGGGFPPGCHSGRSIVGRLECLHSL